jgi:hypothetical protein
VPVDVENGCKATYHHYLDVEPFFAGKWVDSLLLQTLLALGQTLIFP